MASALLVGPDGIASGFLRGTDALGMFRDSCPLCHGVLQVMRFQEELRKLHAFESKYACRGVNLKEIKDEEGNDLYPVRDKMLLQQVELGERLLDGMIQYPQFGKDAVRYCHRILFGENAGFPSRIPVVPLAENERLFPRRQFDTGSWWLLKVRIVSDLDDDGDQEWTVVPAQERLTRLEAAAFLEERYKTISERLGRDPSFRACLDRDALSVGRTLFNTSRLIGWIQQKSEKRTKLEEPTALLTATS